MNNLRIGTRLGLAFGLVLLITALIAVTGLWRMGTLKAANQEIATAGIERSSLAQQWANNINVNWVRASSVLKTSDTAYGEALQKDWRRPCWSRTKPKRSPKRWVRMTRASS